MCSRKNTGREKPVFKAGQPDDSYKFRPLPPPSGNYPYRLDLEAVVAVPAASKLVFHMVGDSGSIQGPAVQQVLAREMGRQIRESPSEERPLFLYHLGDVVYKYGEAENYYEQFFEPFEHYPAPIFAIPGNHDADVNPDSDPYPSLSAFTQVFCDSIPQRVSFSGDSKRKSNIQPNVYWTLRTPLANFIGLYSNVPKFGMITEAQKDWFVNELKAAAAEKSEKAIILCVHHAPYSADTNHGSSRIMIELLEWAFREAGVRPDIVFSGHVHNYQRFEKMYNDGNKVTFVVSGAGGYHELHTIATRDNKDFPDDSPLFDQVDLKTAAVGKHGFLKIHIERSTRGINILGQYFVLPEHTSLPGEDAASLFDEFRISRDSGQS